MEPYRRWEPPADTLPVGIYAGRTKYGYWLNINHPEVRPAFEEYCFRHGYSIRYPLSDLERRTFEVLFLRQRGDDRMMPNWIRFQLAEALSRVQNKK